MIQDAHNVKMDFWDYKKHNLHNLFPSIHMLLLV